MSLLDMSLSGAALILAVTVLRAVAINRLPKRTFLALWVVALGRLMIPYTLPSALSVYTLLGRLVPAQEAVNGTVINPALPVVPAVNEAAVTAPAVLAASPKPVDWLSVLWLVGALACAGFFVVSYFRCRRRFSRALPAEHSAVRAWLDAHPLRRTVSIRVCACISTPLTYGVLRPVILLPKTMDWNDSQSLDYVLTHELIHIRRFDGVTKLALAAVLCLHWFNPAVWVMYALANRDLELSCDEAVVRQFGRDARASYATALIRMEEARGGAPLYNYFSKNAMEERIVAIMKIKRTSLAALVLAVGLVTGATVVFATSAKPQTVETFKDDDVVTYIAREVAREAERTKALLERYVPFGLSYNIDLATGELSMSWQEKPVHSVFDAKTEVWIANNQRGLDLGPDAIDLQAVYDAEGNLIDVKESKHPAEAISVSAENPSIEELMAEYGPFDITFDGSTMRYKGERVELFVDGVEVDGGWALRYSHTDYRNGLRLRTVRQRKDNGDGSYDPFGPLTGIVPMEKEAYESLFTQSPIQQAATGVTVLIKEGAEEDNNVDFRDAFNQKFGPYGVSFVPSGTFGNIYWNGQLVNVFVDDVPNGKYQTLSSLASGGIDLQAVYDDKGNLTGVEEVKRELKNLADEPVEIQEYIWEMYKGGLLQENTDYDLSFFAQRAADEGITSPNG